MLCPCSGSDDCEDDEVGMCNIETDITSIVDFRTQLEKMKQFGLSFGSSVFMENLVATDDILNKEFLTKCDTQKKVSDYFKPL